MDYKYGKIYKIISDLTDKIYIGSTCSTLVKRYSQHKINYTSINYHYVSVWDLFDIGETDIILIEDYPCERKDQLHARERYYIEQNKSVYEKLLITLIEKALTKTGYTIKTSSIENKCVIGKRGLEMNEWGSVTGVYYIATTDKVQIYIKTKITQDITGGFKNNIAKKVGILIENYLK